MSKEFRNLKVKSGSFYISHKEQVDNTKKVELKDGRIYYHELIPMVVGKFSYLKLEDTKYGKIIKFTIEDDLFYNVVELKLHTQSNNLDPFAMSFIQYLGNLVQGESYKVVINTINKNQKGFLYKNIIFLDLVEGKQIPWAIQPSEVPKTVVKENPLGDKTYDSTDKENFYLVKLSEVVQMTERPSSTATPNTEPTPVVETTNGLPVSSEFDNKKEEDDLPF